MRFPVDVILVFIRWYAAYHLSYRLLKEMMHERGVLVDHSSINRWAIRFRHCWKKLSEGTSAPSVPVGGWMRHTSGSTEPGSICIGQSTSGAKGSTSCWPPRVMQPPLSASSRKPQARHCARQGYDGEERRKPDRTGAADPGPRSTDKDSSGKIPQQHCRAGSPRDQTHYAPDARLQNRSERRVRSWPASN